jgi:hypothetical protein
LLLVETVAPRILIVRLSAIGDVIQAAPIACALREHFPKAFIAWTVAGRTALLLQGHKAIDRVIQLQRGWLKSPRRVALRRRLHERNSTSHGSPRTDESCHLAWLSARNGSRLAPGPRAHAVDEYRSGRYAEYARY